MNLIFTNLVIILLLLFAKQILVKARKKTTKDERTQLIGYKAAQATFVVFTITIALSSFILIFFGQYGRIPSNYIYYLGVIMSYLTCLILVLFIILYAYYNKQS